MLSSMLRALSMPAANERGPLFMDQVLAAVHQGNPRKAPITLLILRHAGEVTLALEFPDDLRGSIEGQFYAHYPEAKISGLAPEATLPAAGMTTWTAEMTLAPDLYPMRRFSQFEDPLTRRAADPVTALFTSLANDTPPSLQASVSVTVIPAGHRRIHRVQKCIRMLARPAFAHHHRLASIYRSLALSERRSLRFAAWVLSRFVPHGDKLTANLHASETRLHEREDDLVAANEKAGKLLFATRITLHVSGPPEAALQAKARLREIAGTFGQFNAPRRNAFHMGHIVTKPGRGEAKTFLMATDEVATLWHPATTTVKAPTMTVVESREAEPPVRLPTANDHPGLALLGQALFRNRRQACGLLPDDRRRHVLIEGKTGMGKSTLLHRLIATDIAAGRGAGLIDPHGDLCEAILASVPSGRSNDVVLFDIADTTHPLAFNILHCPDPSQRTLTVSGIVGAFKKIWGDFFGPRMEHILRNTLLTLIEVPGSTLLSVSRMLGDARFRDHILTKVSDPVVRSFWLREFASMPPKLQAEAVSPIYNKVGQLVSNPLLRNILGQSRSTLDLRKVMDEGKVLLVNLSKGRIGEDASALLGAFLVTAIQQAAMSRADSARQDRPDFYLFIDEFQNFATEAFATILSEARKYRLNLIVANQYLDQIDDATRAAVFGNIGSMIFFAVGVQDAEVLAEQLGGDLIPKDLMNSPASRRMPASSSTATRVGRSRCEPCRLLPRRAERASPLTIRRYCRQRYGRPVAVVESEIAAASSNQTFRSSKMKARTGSATLPAFQPIPFDSTAKVRMTSGFEPSVPAGLRKCWLPHVSRTNA